MGPLCNRLSVVHRKPKKIFKGVVILGLIGTETLQNETSSMDPQISTRRKLAEKGMPLQYSHFLWERKAISKD